MSGLITACLALPLLCALCVSAFSALAHSFCSSPILADSPFLLTSPFMPAPPTHRSSSDERTTSAETTAHLKKPLRKKEFRLPRQRRVILEVMDNAEQHLDVDQILERA